MKSIRLIDADELITAFPCGETVRTECVRATIKHMPTIEERKKGKWKPISDGYVDIYECNQCGETEDYERNYCPNCGALMR